MKKQRDIVQEEVDRRGMPIKILLVDGFLLYGSSVLQLRPLFDVKIFLPLSYELIKARREARAGYVTLDGYWADPEGYVDGVVWPNYVAEHAFLFKDGDVRAGRIDEPVVKELGISICEEDDMKDIGAVFDWAAQQIVEAIARVSESKITQ
jgi:nicotinamide/nicotinate riboside kinase